MLTAVDEAVEECACRDDYGFGAYGAAICGAGPSVFAFCAPSQANRIANAMEESHPLRGRALVTKITDKGMFRTL